MSEPKASGTAIVTGGASGIGAACVRALAHDHFAVVVADLRLEAASSVASEVDADGPAGRVVPFEVDVRDEERVAACVEQTLARFGSIDVLVNAAARTDREHHDRDLDVAAMDLSVWRETFATDLDGMMSMCKHVVPVMANGGGGSIVNISSNSAEGGDLVRAAYSAAKAGVNSLTRSLAVAYGRASIRANAVSPAGVAGPSFERNLSAELRQRLADQSLLPYLGRPEDVAALVAFLASDGARYITGQVIAVDGGARAQLPHVPQSRPSELR